MWTAAEIVDRLRERGELWEPVRGAVGLRGETLRLYEALSAAIGTLSRSVAGEEWRVPAALDFASLARADYFASFPQWLTVASHLSSDPVRLERLARSDAPADVVGEMAEPCEAALSPAVCYHVYPRFARQWISSPTLVTVEGTCWRHEGGRRYPLERGWAFTMREVVCLGTRDAVEEFRQRGIAAARAFLASLGLDGEVVPATDPFFAPTARGRRILQRLKGLKDELRLPSGPADDLAAASFNHHENFFGEAFDIRSPDGSPAASGCVAFGLERWLLAFLVAHGPDPAAWPSISPDTSSSKAVSHPMEEAS